MRNALLRIVSPFLVFLATATPVPTAAQVCAPVANGHLADAMYEGTAIFWQPVVEYQQMVLTIGGPCEDVVRVFGPKDQISFDLEEIERVIDGQYTWELRRVATVDPGVQQELEASRGTGEEDALWWSFFQQGAIPAGPYVESRSFAVVNGQILDPGSEEESQKSATLAPRKAVGAPANLGELALVAGVSPVAAPDEAGGNVLASKDTVFTGDVTVFNSLCVGFDCQFDNTYSDTTILISEANTRIKFNDTSGAVGFPRRDWEIEANSSDNGGASYLGFNDCGESHDGGCADDLVFAVEAGVRQNALYVESDGDIGLGTASPAMQLHAIKGDTPGLRLEQDGSRGFDPQAWDVAGNESGFFVRDVTNGSRIPFKVLPGAFSNALVVGASGDVGVGTRTPDQAVHIRRTANPGFALEDVSALGMPEHRWDFEMNNNGLFQITRSGTGGAEILVRARQDPGGLETMDVDGSIEADAFNLSSSRSFKTGFVPVDVREVLALVAELPVSEWSFKWDEAGTRHIGPMAEDFLELFRVGGDSTNISVGDAAGVALAAIQGLYLELQAKEQEIAGLKEELGRRLEELEATVRALQD